MEEDSCDDGELAAEGLVELLVQGYGCEERAARRFVAARRRVGVGP